ncbi:hypothetical protein A3Q56_07973 [Intoshia linei]|uniref:Uncharacterized protein n=1 Tax=Intoshia linei TaxID=1819745 RepID=A0A177AQM8_9BILA|nr:hypothetical protein A3Q56_07973 [Intoshia linei]
MFNQALLLFLLLLIAFVKAGFSAVVDIFSKKKSKLDVNNRGIMRLRLN